ncbi:hypothetical protein B0H13DRAFT_1916249 [Mycena leptocephala]|nr:hypothetical protein B0H13DRAFT_1916249 [Mycena leptocephala]
MEEHPNAIRLARARGKVDRAKKHHARMEIQAVSGDPDLREESEDDENVGEDRAQAANSELMSKHTNEGHPKPSAATQKPREQRTVRSLILIRKIGVGETSEKRRSVGTETLAANSEFTSPPHARDIPKSPDPSAKKAVCLTTQDNREHATRRPEAETKREPPSLRKAETSGRAKEESRLQIWNDHRRLRRGCEGICRRGKSSNHVYEAPLKSGKERRRHRASIRRMWCGADLSWTRGRKLKPPLASSTSRREGRHPEAPQSKHEGMRATPEPHEALEREADSLWQARRRCDLAGRAAGRAIEDCNHCDRACGRIETRRRSLAASSSKIDTEVRAHEEERCGTKNAVSSEVKGRAGNSYCSKGGCAGLRIAIFPTNGTALAIVAWSEARTVHEDGVSSRGPRQAPDLPTSMRKAWRQCSRWRRDALLASAATRMSDPMPAGTGSQCVWTRQAQHPHIERGQRVAATAGAEHPTPGTQAEVLESSPGKSIHRPEALCASEPFIREQ